MIMFLLLFEMLSSLVWGGCGRGGLGISQISMWQFLFCWRGASTFDTTCGKPKGTGVMKWAILVGFVVSLFSFFYREMLKKSGKLSGSDRTIYRVKICVTLILAAVASFYLVKS